MPSKILRMIIDFHAHVQPGADHGCRNSAAAKEQLSLAAGANVGAVVAVSHFYPLKDDTADYLARRRRAKDKLQSLCRQENALPQVLFGSEVTLCGGLDRLDCLRELCIDGTDCMLAEMPFERWSTRLLDTLDALRHERDISVLLAHADRYDPKAVETLLKDGYPCQLNYDGFGSFFKSRRLRKWAENGWVAALGSDIHGTQVGYKHLNKARSALGDRLFDEISARSARLLNIEVAK
ncbi:MAG: hypothetical protein IJE90_01750 [Clostridia bacterium]|nr:hypothetical protein [Clostridia bacterium]